LGAGFQTCRKLIDDGAIGEPLAAAAFMVCRGHESWHPNPDFYYQPGGGPMFDMGPYYLTALISLMGPVRRVTGSTKITFPERIITSQPNYGRVIKVNTPTHITGIMDFANGAIGTITTSFDVWGARLPNIEIYGSAGTLSTPDPNTFGGPIRLLRAKEKEWIDVPLIDRYADNSRGIGVADMAKAIVSGGKYRANGKMAHHVLDIMQSFHDASKSGKHIELTSSCEQPEALPANVFS
jgi:predicted dehydrogenase